MSRCQRPAAVLAAALALLLLGATAGCARAQPSAVPAPQRADTAALHRTLDSLAQAHHGIVGYTVLNVDTRERLERLGDSTFSTASLIKVPILVTLYTLVGQDSISLSDPLTMLKLDKVGGAGMLQFLHPGLQLTVGDAAWLMSTLSDNTATNLLIDRIAVQRVWRTMEALGLPHTKVHGRSMLVEMRVSRDSAARYGLGVTTPNEMARLFERMALGQAVSPSADSAMLATLEQNTDGDMLQRYAGGVRSPHKTGATDQVRTECALFYLQTRVVACVLTNQNADTRWILDNEPQLTMARMGAAIVAAWPRAVPPG